MTIRPTFTYAATIEKVVDGDTLDVALDLGMRITFHTRLRVQHVDAPEHGTPTGDAATAFVRSLLAPGTDVVVQTAKPDKYGRSLAVVTFMHDGHEQSLGDVLLSTGHAVSYEGGSKLNEPPLAPVPTPDPTP